MSIIQDKLGNDLLRPNGGVVDANFGAGMIMFSHLPPVTSFTRLHSVGPQEMILKKERDSPDCSGGGGGRLPGAGHYVHAIKQEKVSEHDYRLPLYPAGLLEVAVGHHNLLVHDVNVADLPSPLGKEPVGRKGRRSNADGQEGRARKKRREAQPLPDGGDGVSPGAKPHVCQHCGAAFRSSYHLRRHVLIHTGERPFRCSQCNMSFIQKYLLQRHEKIHSGEKPFSCDQCNMRFIQKYHMERHKRTHSGEKPYRCDNCQQFFSRTDRLLKHKRTCGDALRKVPDPGALDLARVDTASYGITQGSGRKKSRSKMAAEGGGRKKKRQGEDAGLRAPPHVVNGAYGVHQYPLENQSEPGPSVQHHHGRGPKMAFKKAHRKSGKADSVEPGDDLTQTNGKAGNYDDAVQFLKKRRYFQNVTSSTSEYDLLSPHPAALLQMTDADSGLDKSCIPDEVLQSLLEQYTNKPDASQQHHHHHHDIHFDLGEPHVEALQPAPDAGDKGVVTNEYSRFLLQALERSNHSAGFPPPYGTFLYSECGFGPSSPQSAFHLLDQHHQLTPSQELNASASKSATVGAFPPPPPSSKASPYQIENFAQAFGSQFKSEEPIRTPVSDFSGYSGLLADAGEPPSPAAAVASKAPSSQSFR
ncbi:zinc finger protein 281-like [Syngnathus typhle]|uniref:zinc finger protein 281-like n=1 Tax=Syngnathus typhle TaxID=161592 RepID=UPI002A69AB8E|nr:zinc finger protein 281-like [Syngnathus typhle]XP_061159713.1 zinc finger protein 281-like [Syngnathus typhle]XP_061159714.1 zinc finger protein 281-like [Syngnathus typhle]